VIAGSSARLRIAADFFRRIQSANAPEREIRAMRRLFVVYAKAELMKVSHEPKSSVRHAAQAVVRSARARGGCRAHVGRLQPLARSFCTCLRLEHAPSTARIHPNPARIKLIRNLPSSRGCVSYFTLAIFFGLDLTKSTPCVTGSRRGSSLPGDKQSTTSLSRDRISFKGPSGQLGVRM
jgi:hypothetical protein